MDEETCLRVAIALGMANPATVLMAAGMDRAKNAGDKSSWSYYARKFKAGV
jgi:hypothetical protein